MICNPYISALDLHLAFVSTAFYFHCVPSVVLATMVLPAYYDTTSLKVAGTLSTCTSAFLRHTLVSLKPPSTVESFELDKVLPFAGANEPSRGDVVLAVCTVQQHKLQDRRNELRLVMRSVNILARRVDLILSDVGDDENNPIVL